MYTMAQNIGWSGHEVKELYQLHYMCILHQYRKKHAGNNVLECADFRDSTDGEGCPVINIRAPNRYVLYYCLHHRQRLRYSQY